MSSISLKTIIDYLIETKMKRISTISYDGVNSGFIKFYDNRVGISTDAGSYRNGFTTEVINNKWVKILIYTSAGGVVDIEERFLFKIVGDTYKIKKWEGWDGINLLSMHGSNIEYMNMLEAMYKSEIEINKALDSGIRKFKDESKGLCAREFFKKMRPDWTEKQLDEFLSHPIASL